MKLLRQTPALAAHPMSDLTSTSALAEQLAEGALDPDLLALVWILAESGVPLTVAAMDTTAGRDLRSGICALLPTEHRAADLALAGGTVAAGSLEDVLRVLGGWGHGDPGDSDHGVPGHGGAADGEIADEVRDLGIVLILRDRRVEAAHYVRPVERDAAGHLQRRPPALLAAWNAEAHEPDHFYWAITDELATRAGMERDEFEAEHRRRRERLSNMVPRQPGAGNDADARN